ncbi:copper amine oxidase N-terminal domain-containing protein [Desertibacillus haloalkaliphilus]|uniref:copper amine oxidase N-terminal domain-containing protein n=1 Tax=Desertibacillus haloalkaliphilus TaxID=1328930 RepID=UPI001C2763EA|nr:copper amine oxidase N-terminal domain-containing protein [Desertibacillus haloalkaliphilus]MBU8905953.1 copper amine oxidase N-terminal domain-containing protein [Desertibacillus haloalkaliphilus]
MRHFIKGFLALALILSVIIPVNSGLAAANPSIVIDGEQVKTDVGATIEDGRVLVPLRLVSESLGQDVKWNQQAKTVTVTDAETTVELTIGSATAVVNGEATSIDVPATLKQNRTLVPLRFLIEANGQAVSWDNQEKIVTVSTNGEVVTGVEVDGDAFLEKSLEVELNSFSTEMEIEQIMNVANESITMDMAMNLDVVVDPFGMYEYVVADVEGESIVTESYYTEDGFYSYNEFIDTWIKFEGEFYEDLIQLSDMQLDPTAQLEMIDKYFDDYRVWDEGDIYRMTVTMSEDGYQEMLDEILELLFAGLEDDFLGEMGGELYDQLRINDMSYTFTFDKETLYPLDYEAQADLEISIEGENMQIIQSMTGSYSNINQVEEIVVPDEVLEAVQSIEDAFGEELYEFEEEIEVEFE